MSRKSASISCALKLEDARKLSPTFSVRREFTHVRHLWRLWKPLGEDPRAMFVADSGDACSDGLVSS